MRSRNTVDITSLPDGGPVTSDVFGQKAALLAQAALAGFRIPTGFSVSARLCYSILHSEVQEPAIDTIRTRAKDLFETSSSGKLIVRSSSPHECNMGGGFSGLFESCFDISTPEEVVSAIGYVVQRASRDSLRTDLINAEYRLADPQMAVLVQEQLNPKCSGLAKVSKNDIYIEACRGHLRQLTTGQTSPIAFDFSVDDPLSLNCASQHAVDNEIDQLKDVLLELPLLKLCATFSGSVLEFGIDPRGPVIFQVDSKPAGASDEPGRLATTTDHGEHRPALPLAKASAMHFFRANGLFEKRLEVFSCKLPLDTVLETSRPLFEGNKRTTVRFSQGNKIGLPRGFFSSWDDGRNFIERNYRDDWDVIIHEYIRAVRSFEILFAPDLVLLEHIPGMWESDNRLQPDVIIMDRRKRELIYFRYLRERTGKFVDQDINKELYAAPLDIPICERLVDMIDDIQQVVQRQHPLDPEATPINVHAVWDELADRYQCLNLRKGFTFPLRPRSWPDHGFHYVSQFSDLASWNGKAIIRLNLINDRGRESDLYALAKELAAIDGAIVIDFGLLSHPAMVLRDFGCNLIPGYLFDELSTDNQYFIERVRLDVHDDAFSRIVREPRLYETSEYLVVRDKDPVSEAHLLGVCKRPSPCTYDTNSIEDVWKLYEKVSHDHGDQFYFERGRLSFCSSGFTDPQDHFHLIGGIDFEATYQKLCEAVGGKQYGTLIEAYEAVSPGIQPYCVFGSPELGFVMASAPVMGKRLLRRSIRRNR